MASSFYTLLFRPALLQIPLHCRSPRCHHRRRRRRHRRLDRHPDRHRLLKGRMSYVAFFKFEKRTTEDNFCLLFKLFVV